MKNVKCTWVLKGGTQCKNYAVTGNMLCSSHILASRAMRGEGPKINDPRFLRPALSEPAMVDEDIESIGRALNLHRVKYVVIGGIAAELHGADIERSKDMDICVLRVEDGQENLERLVEFLKEVDAIPRGWPSHISYDLHSPDNFRDIKFANYETRYGSFDIGFTPSGFDKGYAQFEAGAVIIEFRGVPLMVASLEDIITSKTAANRDKDIVTLGKLRERLRQIGKTK